MSATVGHTSSEDKKKNIKKGQGGEEKKNTLAHHCGGLLNTAGSIRVWEAGERK